MTTDLPAVINSGDVPEWSGQTQVVVVGFGISGGSAAVEAATAGAHVTVLERAAEAGGTSAMAGGHFYLGGGTAVQRATGQDDSPEEMAKYLTAVSREPEADKIEAYCRDSVAHFDWLESLGFQFERSYYPEKNVIQPGTQGLMYTGNEKVWPFRDQATPAPRGHKVPKPGDTGGGKIVTDLLVQRAGELGIDIRYETGAEALVVDERGAVVGVRWRHFNESGYLRADAVILAAGGFVMNKEMVTHYAPYLAEKPWVLGNTYDDGLGIRMGMSVGAATKFMDQAFVTAPIYPPAGLLKGLVVNKEGRRFVAEDSYHARTSAFALEQPDSAAFLICDVNHMENPKIELCPFIDGWETVAEMEEALGIPAGNLQETLDEYNAEAARGEDSLFHKDPAYLAPQDHGPWGAYDLSLGKAMYAGFTLGGLVTDLDARVQRDDHTPIDGLFAVGAMACNLAQDAHGYASGTQLGEGSYFGRRAGRRAAGVAWPSDPA